jgi:hypothetical protein
MRVVLCEFLIYTSLYYASFSYASFSYASLIMRVVLCELYYASLIMRVVLCEFFLCEFICYQSYDLVLLNEYIFSSLFFVLEEI